MTETTGSKAIRQGPNIAVASAAALVVEPIMVATHQGALGMIVGLGLAGAAYVAADSFQKSGRELPSLPDNLKKERDPSKPSLAKRLVVGKSVREQDTQPKDERSCVTLQQAQPLTVQAKQQSLDDDLDHADEDKLAPPVFAPTGAFYFSEVLKTFTPTLDKIYVGTMPTGEHKFVRARDLCHTALAGTTRGGKDHIIRMLMSQLCCAHAKVYLLDPNYTRYDLESIDPFGRPYPEDWTPFDAYLKNDPHEMIDPERKYKVIEHYLRLAFDMVEKRLKSRGSGVRLGPPQFLFVNELPAIVDEVPGTAHYLKKILREGAKVGVFVVNASQDFHVSTLFKEIGGGIRKCYRTAFDVGSDPATQNALGLLPLKKLGKGNGSIRCDDTLSAIRLPYVDNPALYTLLGPSTYTKSGMYVEDEDDEIVAYTMQSGRREERYEDEEPHTETLPTRGVTSGVRTVRSAVERKQERDQRLRGMSVAVSRQTAQVARVPETPVVEDDTLSPELRRAYNAFENQLSYRDLGARLGVSKDTAGKWYQRLSDLGYISKDGMKLV